MPNKKYNNPNITISKVYTKKGDKGKTELIGKKNVYKDDIRVKAYGELDELNVIVGGCCQKLSEIKSWTRYSLITMYSPDKTLLV